MKKVFVVDASVTLAWCLVEECSASANRWLEEMLLHKMFVPSIWRYEIANALYLAEQKGRITLSQIQTFNTLLAELPLEIEDTKEMNPIFELAKKHRLSVYDAAYLELATRKFAILVSFDNALCKAAKQRGVVVKL